MATRSVFVRTAAALALAALGLAGCDTMKSMTSGGSEHFGATLSAGEEVPPNSSTGTGSADATYNRSTGTLSYRVTYSGLTGPATAGHIHGPAAPGANAGVVVPFASATSSPITGEAKITPEQYNQLASGQYYVNIHTARNPGGEIRGQLRRR